jgi:hypothetical protein
VSNRIGTERKASIGQDYTFAWSPVDGYPSAAPTLSVAWPTPPGTKTYALAVVRAADTVPAGGYDHANARLSITVTGAIAGALRGILAEYAGEAWLDGGPDFQGPVRVVELVSDGSGAVVGPPASPAVPAVLQLAEPLPRAVDVDGTWSLRWLTYTATIPLADLGSARLRNRRWALPWTMATGTDAPVSKRVEQGLVHVVHAPFDTGLRDAHLLALVPGWARMVPERQSSWAEQRWSALEALVARMRPRLATAMYEDDCLGEQFLPAHALYTAAIVRGGHALLGYAGAAEDAERLQREADAALDRALARVSYLDLNGDAVVDAGETAVTQTLGAVSARSNVFDSGFRTAAGRPTKTNFWDPR